MYATLCDLCSVVIFFFFFFPSAAAVFLLRGTEAMSQRFGIESENNEEEIKDVLGLELIV